MQNMEFKISHKPILTAFFQLIMNSSIIRIVEENDGLNSVPMQCNKIKIHIYMNRNARKAHSSLPHNSKRHKSIGYFQSTVKIQLYSSKCVLWERDMGCKKKGGRVFNSQREKG